MEITDESVVVNSSRLKSVVWNDFDRVRKGDTFVAICRHCKRKLSGSSTSGTSHLRNHLIRCRRRSNHDITQFLTRGKKKEINLPVADLNFEQDQRNDVLAAINPKLDWRQKKDGTSKDGQYFDDKRSRHDLARMIILHGYPLGIVEHIGFRVFIRNLQPLFNLVTFDGVEADCKEIYLKEKQKVYEELDKLPGKISLSADRWSTNGDTDYLCLAAHYIDDSWQSRKKILNFLIIDPSRTEDMLSDLIMTSLRNWDIDRKLFSLTVDDNSAYENIICRIKDQLCQHRFLLCDGQLFDVRCAGNMIKQMALDALEASRNICHKVRESIQYVRSSQTMLGKFGEMVQHVGLTTQTCLCLDNSGKWDSTYRMLQAALEFRDVFPLLQEHDPEYSICPSDTDWDRVAAVTSFLKLLIEDSNIFSGGRSSTANKYFPDICDLHLSLIEWCQNSDEFISSIALRMKRRFDEYWKKCSLTLAIAAILDPRFKMKLIEYYYPQIYGGNANECINIVSNCMKALYNGHAIYSPLAFDGPGGSSPLGGSDGMSSDGRDKLTGFDKYLYETCQSQNAKSDLDKYLEEPLFPRNHDFNILNWWKVHTPRYPILSMMARNILAIPMSKLELDDAYCIGDRTIDQYWSSLRSDTLQALMCAQDWMRGESADLSSPFNPTPLAICCDPN